MSRGSFPAAPPEPDLRSVMRLFPTGVAVLTTGEGADTVATTVNSLTSVTLSPPTLLVSLLKASRAHLLASTTGGFRLHLLAGEQEPLARLFASQAKPTGDALASHFDPADPAGPVLTGSLATLTCTVSAVYPEGDHCLFLGRVTATRESAGSRAALLFHHGRMTTT
ncbi:flavin reductase family protein [Streptomyces sp. LP11]|uniref:Flavin reductase family protein n=1 Tax=Streptomyces pyxinicus TaxID=2970331 RepID=A0ABT2B3D5_9ACTN|nr:flavin reductase family protein [Streptomyces sp. LP11]MCS0602957.1 flavin reductase family protein [Streptomyces sp. LP11]